MLLTFLWDTFVHTQFYLLVLVPFLVSSYWSLIAGKCHEELYQWAFGVNLTRSPATECHHTVRFMPFHANFSVKFLDFICCTPWPALNYKIMTAFTSLMISETSLWKQLNWNGSLLLLCLSRLSHPWQC